MSVWIQLCLESWELRTQISLENWDPGLNFESKDVNFGLDFQSKGTLASSWTLEKIPTCSNRNS